MRRLTLVRHAKSSWDYPELSDFERPLNARGRRDAPAMARRLDPLLKRPLRLVSSPALRAITTAHAFADVLGIAQSEIRVEPAIYEAAGSTLLDLLRRLDDADPHVLLFGHNPGLSECAHALAECTFGELPTCGVAMLALDIARWRELKPGKGRVEQYHYPKEEI
jgi:phosphohistidine phosphatase